VRLVDETVLVARDGTNRIVSATGSPILDTEARTIGVVLAFRDVTERRLMLDEMAKAERLELLGILAGGIAHDFNNILTAILGNIFLCRSAMTADSQAAERLAEAERACNRARNLTQQLLTFAKGGAPVKTMASLRELIMESAQFALRGANVGCDFKIPADLWPAEVDEGQISQVIQNLAINADQAMPDGGTVTITAANLSRAAAATPSFPNLTAPHYVRVTVTDTGVGIPERYLGRIFDPFFTTKHKGSGLGLATVYAIVRRHEGHITVKSTPGRGTTFSLVLPAAPERRVAAQAEEAAVVRGTGNVLVMDDDEGIIDLLSAMLSDLGYDATFASGGEEAVEIYAQALRRGEPFDAVILDLTVPGGMGGKDAFARLRELDPGVKAIVSSGYSTDPVMADFQAHGFKGVIAKPYKVENLSEVIARVVGEERDEDR
jgi:signal transduction histidine kinase/CheY-like chemotaxis protein